MSDKETKRTSSEATEDADLSDIRGNMVRARLQNRRMDGANLESVNLCRAVLNKLSLRGANLRGAMLCGAQLSHVDLGNADLKGADLKGATLQNVNLEGATLDEADLGGAILKGCRLESTSVRNTWFVGAELASVEFDGTDLDGAVMDGAVVEQCKLDNARLVQASLRGARIDKCLFVNTAFEQCDLSGASLQMPLIKGARITDCSLRGTLLSDGRFKDLTIDNSRVDGCVLERCSGVRAEDEQKLTEAGAVFVMTMTTRLWRMVLRDKRLRGAALGAAALLLVVGLVFAMVPGVWPSALLSWRMASLQHSGERTGENGWCDRYVEFGEIIARRSLVDRERQSSHLNVTAHCYETQARHDEAERVYRRWAELTEPDSEAWHRAHHEMALFYTRRDKLVEAEEVVQELLKSPSVDAMRRLEALRVMADIMRMKGADGPRNARWRELQVEHAEAILGVEERNSEQLARIPEELYVVGEFEWADRLLTRVQPPLEEDAVWAQVSPALDRRRQQGFQAALELLTHLAQTEFFAGDHYRSFLVLEEGTLLLEAGQPEEARELVEVSADTDTANVRLARAIVGAKIDLHEDDAKGALSRLAGVEPEEEVPWILAETFYLCRLDAHLELGNEKDAADGLIPMLRLVDDEQKARQAAEMVQSLASRFEQPGLLGKALAAAENSYLQQFGAETRFNHSLLSRRAEDGELEATDPVLLSLLNGGDVGVCTEAIRWLLRSAWISGNTEPAVALATQHAKKGEGADRIGPAFALIDWHLECGDMDAAHGVVSELELWDHVSTQEKPRLYDLAVRRALAEGDLAAGRDWLDRLRSERPPLDAWAEVNVTQHLIEAYRQQGDWENVLQLVDTAPGSGEAAASGTYTHAAVWALLAAGRVEEAEAQLDEFAASTSACRALMLESRTRESLGLTPTDVGEVFEACQPVDVPYQAQIEAADYLAERNQAEKAMSLLQGTRNRALPLEAVVQIAFSEARLLAGTGKPEQALEVLERIRPRISDEHVRREICGNEIDLYRQLEDAEGIVATYTDYAEDASAADARTLWETAATALLQLHEGDLVAELGGEPGWDEALVTTRATLTIQRHMNEGAFSTAWTELGKAVEGAAGEGELSTFLWLSDELRWRSGDVTKRLDLLRTMQAGAKERSPLQDQITCRMAADLSDLARPKETVELLRPVLTAGTRSECRDEALGLFARNLGQTASSAQFESEFASLQAAGFAAADLQRARLDAVDGFCARGNHAAGRALLEPLAGVELDEQVAAERYSSVLRPWLEDALFEEALTLASRFPPGPAHDSCGVDLLLIDAMPHEEPVRQQLVERLPSGCDAAKMSADKAVAVANIIGESDTKRAVAFLQGWSSGHAASPASEQAKVDIAEARQRAHSGEADVAEKMLDEVISDAGELWLVVTAAEILIYDVYSADPAKPAAEVEKRSEQIIETIEERWPLEGSSAVCSIARGMVAFHNQRGAHRDALQWQLDLIDKLPSESEERAWELLGAARLEMENSRSVSARCRSFTDEARSVAVPGTPLDAEVLRVELLQGLLTAGTGRVEQVLAPALERIPQAGRDDFLGGLADTLDHNYQRPEQAQAVREWIAKAGATNGTGS